MSDITYTFTRDANLLGQYFELRKEIYMQDFNLNDFSDHEDDYDNKEYTHILVVCDKDKIIGGSRIIIHPKKSDVLLPVESQSFSLKDTFPDLALENKSYSEVNRTVLLPEYRQGKIGENIVYNVILHSKVCGAEYLFAIGPAVQARNNRKHCRKFGINFNIMEEVTVPDKASYHGRKMYLARVDLNDVVFPDNAKT